jgi:hypothetical protein
MGAMRSISAPLAGRRSVSSRIRCAPSVGDRSWMEVGMIIDAEVVCRAHRILLALARGRVIPERR